LLRSRLFIPIICVEEALDPTQKLEILAQGQEVEFHEIEIGDRIILQVFMRSKLPFFMRSNSKPNLT
jgi:hypothetical protein